MYHGEAARETDSLHVHQLARWQACTWADTASFVLVTAAAHNTVHVMGGEGKEGEEEGKKSVSSSPLELFERSCKIQGNEWHLLPLPVVFAVQLMKCFFGSLFHLFGNQCTFVAPGFL